MTENERLIADILKGQAFKLIAEENGKLRIRLCSPGLPIKIRCGIGTAIGR